MNFDIKGIDQLLSEKKYNVTDSVYVFQSSRKLFGVEACNIEIMLADFVNNWTSHDDKVSAGCFILLDQFLIFVINENNIKLSGCSKDKLHNLIKELEKKIGATFLDRNLLAFLIKGRVEVIHFQQLENAFMLGSLTNSDLYFNNLINTFGQLKSNWIIPVGKSWLSNKFY